jgi:signal transduction histidine kinase
MDKLKSEKLHKFSHDLKNSITVINLNLELIKRSKIIRDNGVSVKTYVTSIEKRLEAMEKILNDLVSSLYS